MTRLPLAAALALLAGCATSSNTQTDVYAAAVALTAADQLAFQYVTLPTCAAHPLPCANPAIVTEIKAKAQQAHDAVKAAEQGGDNPSIAAANAAIAALTSAIPAQTKPAS